MLRFLTPERKSFVRSEKCARSEKSIARPLRLACAAAGKREGTLVLGIGKFEGMSGYEVTRAIRLTLGRCVCHHVLL